MHPLESGGVLLGWRAGADKVVAGITGPGPYALHGRHRFLPDHKWQVEQIRRVFKQSDGDIDYLGDWHSHPDGVAEMSCEDASTLKRISKKVEKPLMLITAGNGVTDRSDACWQGEVTRYLFYKQVSPQRQELRIFDPPEHWPLVTALCSARYADNSQE